MRIFDAVFGSQADGLERAMDRASLRHELLTKNISNINVPGYKRQDIDFGIELDRASRRQTKIETDKRSIRVDGSSVDLEHEVVSLAETELRYQALADMTSRYFSDLKSVIREGR